MKKQKSKKIKSLAFLQIVLLITISFAIAFFFSESFVNAQTALGGKPGTVPFHFPPATTPTPAALPIDPSQLPAGFKPEATPISQFRTVGTAPPPSPPGAGIELGGFGDLFTGGFFGRTGGAGALSALTSGLIWGAIAGGLSYFLAKAFGATPAQAKSVGLSVGFGVGTGTTFYHLAANSILGPSLVKSSVVLGIGIGAAVGIGIFLATYKKEKKELVVFECLPWEPPVGGNRCEECNKDPKMPCSEYRCKSLGQACELVNKGTENELCVWIHKDDTQAPKITPWEEALFPDGLKYFPDRTISPPNTGFKILKQPEGCLAAFSNFQFGIKTDEPAQCRADFELKNSYSEMQFLFGETNLFLQEHKQLLKAPSPFTEEGDAVPEIHNNGEYTLYTRCIDANGNGERSAAVAFKFCVDPGPDTSPPEIVGTSIIDGSPVRKGVDKVPIEVYTNEPAECKWSRQDKAFEVMENTMDCATESFQINAQLNYPCSGELTAIKDRENNDFFFRCKDKPGKPENERNLMRQSKKLTLRGTEELVINKIGPNGTIEGSTTTVPVTLTAETSHGANQGIATCFLSGTGETDSYFEMFATNNFIHNMTLDFAAGEHTWHFRCIDEAGNVAEAQTKFNILIDRDAPQITRVFKDGNNLKIITNEPANCVYSLTSCNYGFEQATQDTVFLVEDVTARTIHYTPWNPNIAYYIKCQDLNGNRPREGTCQVIAQGAEF